MTQKRTIDDLNEADRSLVEAAREASAQAYAPYSGFAVGAAVRSKSGSVYTGANLENASYGLGICAEVSVMAVANAADDFDIETIAIVAHKFTEPEDASLVAMSCGRCRQVIFEAAQTAGVDVRVLSCSGDLSQIVETRISELLPAAFGPENLTLDSTWPDSRARLKARVSFLKGPANKKAD